MHVKKAAAAVVASVANKGCYDQAAARPLATDDFIERLAYDYSVSTG
ncbi:hypothetical protein [Spirosoma areae]